MSSIGGGFFIHKGIYLDFCFEAVIKSYLDNVDDVWVLALGPDDGTMDILKKYEGERFHIIEGEWSECTTFDRFKIYTNRVLERLRTDWVLHLQADEVLHENAGKFLRQVIKGTMYDGFLMRRVNLWRSKDLCVRYDAPVKPCDDVVMRFGKRYKCPTFDMMRDSDLVCNGRVCWDYIDRLPIIHYGMVRDRLKMAEKVVGVQSTDHGASSRVDARLVEALKTGVYKYEQFGWDFHLMPMPFTHPKYAKEWLDAH